MSTVRNILISCGVFWLSLLVAGLLIWPFSKINDGIIYGDGVLSAIAMGVMSSVARTIAAMFAGAFVTLIIPSRKPEGWALIVGVLYIIGAPVRFHWGNPATGFDRLWQGVSLVFPCLACFAVAVFVARLRRKKSGRVT